MQPDLTTTINSLDEMCRELERGANPRRALYLILEIKDGTVDVARQLRGVEDERYVIVRTMSEIIADTAHQAILEAWRAMPDGVSRDKANEVLGDLVGRVGGLTAHYRSRIGSQTDLRH